MLVRLLALLRSVHPAERWGAIAGLLLFSAAMLGIPGATSLTVDDAVALGTGAFAVAAIARGVWQAIRGVKDPEPPKLDPATVAQIERVMLKYLPRPTPAAAPDASTVREVFDPADSTEPLDVSPPKP